MKKMTIIITLLFMSFTSVFGQEVTDSITMKKVFGGYHFYQGEEKIDMNQLVNTIKPNEQAYEQIKSAQSERVFALLLSGTGGFMIGWQLGKSIGGGEPNWLLAGVGVGLFVVSIPISKSSNKKIKQAVDLYNHELQTASFWDKKELNLSMTESGVGLVLRF
ncbi:MAG: hypothetical protein KAH25_03240 [Bacteroidales bacterium]|nr:hypothetical protein [Bacteroidales bacterium]